MSQRKPRILIVDDERFFREAIAEILRGAGLECVTAETGGGALEAATDTGIGVVVLDVRLPDIDGITVLERLRTLRPSLRVIMLSGATDQESVLGALRLGACDYLAKPLHEEELVLAVRRAMETYTVNSNWTKLRGRLDRLVARIEELAGSVAGREGEDRLEPLREGLAEAASEVLEAEKTSLMLLDPGTDLLRVVACVGRNEEPDEFDSVRVGEAVAGVVLERGEPLIVTDISTDPRFQAHEEDDRYATPSFAVTPLSFGEQPIGVLCATDRVAGGSFAHEDLALLRILAMQAGELLGPHLELSPLVGPPGLDVTQSFDPIAYAAQLLPKADDGDELDRDAELARQICQAVTDEVEPARVIHEALRPLSTLLPAAPVSVFLIDPRDGELCKEGECDGGVSEDRPYLDRSRGLTGNVLRTGLVVATRDPSADPRFDKEIDTPLGGHVRPFLCIPLRLRGKVVGVFRAFLQEGGDASARTAEVIGAALSAAVRNALLYRSLVETIEEVADARRAARD